MSLPAKIEMDLFVERASIDLKGKLKDIILVASNLSVTNEPAFQQITSFYSQSKDWENQIETMRKFANKPDQERINIRNDKAKELLDPLRQIQSIAKTKTSQYQAMLEEAKRAEQEKAKEAVELLGLEDAPYIPPVEKTHRGDGAMVYTKTIRKFRIVDQAKVPAQYLKVDEDAVALAIKLGVAEIDGLEIYEEKVTQLRSR
jgi:hypothetical protein